MSPEILTRSSSQLNFMHRWVLRATLQERCQYIRTIHISAKAEVSYTPREKELTSPKQQKHTTPTPSLKRKTIQTNFPCINVMSFQLKIGVDPRAYTRSHMLQEHMFE